MLQEGEVINGRYKVAGLIAKGGLSYVYEVEDLVLPRRLALKEFSPRNLDESEIAAVREQFAREVKILSALRHPRLPEITDSFTFNGRDYMAMELIEGKTLEALLGERSDPFPEEEVRGWALEILDILEYLHGQSPPVIYRDIKPQNIIIVPVRGVRFVDFGIARLFNPVKEQDTIFMGTPGYASPEQFRQRQSDVRSDLYSLGATLHYLLTRRDPGLNPFDFEPVSLVNAGVSPLFEKVIQKALEIKAENRFQSAAEMRKVLTGELSPDEAFASSFVIIEPRELIFTDLAPGAAHEKSLMIKSSSGSDVKGIVTSSHPGLEVAPAELTAPRTSLKVKTLPGCFPRGESVVTSVTVSTEASKITVPVTVQYRPTILRGLSPAIASTLFLIIPVISGLVWMGGFLRLPGAPQWSLMAALFLPALALALLIHRERLRKATLLFYSGLFGGLVLMGSRLNAGAAAAPFFAGTAAVFAAFLSFTVITDALLFILSAGLSRSQRSDMRLVIMASFFAFPTLVFVGPLLKPAEGSFIFSNRIAFVALSAGFSLFFSLLFLLGSLQEEAGRPKGPWSPRLLHGAGTAGLALLFTILWFSLSLQYDTLRGQLTESSLQATGPLASVIYFPLTLLKVFGPLAVGYSGGAMALIVALFFFFFPRFKIFVRAGLALFACAAFMNLSLSFEALNVASAAKQREMIRKNPMKTLMGWRSSGVPVDATMEKFYESLDAARKKAEIKDYHGMGAKYLMASRLLGEKTSLDAEKLAFMAGQAQLLELSGDFEAMKFPSFSVRFSPDPSLFSPSVIKAFKSSPRGGGAGDPAGFLMVPDEFLFLAHGGLCIPLSCDYEVLAASLFYRGYCCECRGDLPAARGYFREMGELLGAVSDKPAGKALLGELNARAPLFEKRDKARYYRDLLSFYSGGAGSKLAIPLALYQIKHMASSLADRASLVDRLYSMNATEQADALVDPIVKKASREIKKAYAEKGSNANVAELASSPSVIEAGLLLGIKHYAHESYGDAFRCLEAAGIDPVTAGNEVYMRKMRDCAAVLRYWDKVAQLSGKLREKSPGALKADEWLTWAWSLDITGRFRDAKPLYKAYLGRQAKEGSAGEARAVLVRNRLAGGPLPTYLFIEQHSEIPSRMRVIIMGEGIPPESLPKISIYYGPGPEPPVTCSDNITLVNRYERRILPKFQWLYYQVHFKDLEKERKERRFRFSLSYEYEWSDGYPIDLERLEGTIMNAKYVKACPPVNALIPQAYNRGAYLLKYDSDQSLVVIPRFFFDCRGGEVPQGQVEVVNYYYNSVFLEDIRALRWEDLFSLFAKEPGKPENPYLQGDPRK
ncbi:MAG: serine/threonine-protein kinase [Candidatus Eremiobacteraeota bacterium]|nr:serine/threonine-protein kinase [Candidatus Eremiobacteraeota bacterium]